MSGVKVSKLGSLQDRLSRQYLYKRVKKEVALNSLLANLVISTHNSKEWQSKISTVWSNYMNLASYLEDEVEQRELDMKREYERWKNIIPEVKQDSSGNIVIGGIVDKI